MPTTRVAVFLLAALPMFGSTVDYTYQALIQPESELFCGIVGNGGSCPQSETVYLPQLNPDIGTPVSATVQLSDDQTLRVCINDFTAPFGEQYEYSITGQIEALQLGLGASTRQDYQRTVTSYLDCESPQSASETLGANGAITALDAYGGTGYLPITLTGSASLLWGENAGLDGVLVSMGGIRNNWSLSITYTVNAVPEPRWDAMLLLLPLLTSGLIRRRALLV